MDQENKYKQVGAVFYQLKYFLLLISYEHLTIVHKAGLHYDETDL
jgi:hypothetical protein